MGDELNEEGVVTGSLPDSTDGEQAADNQGDAGLLDQQVNPDQEPAEEVDYEKKYNESQAQNEGLLKDIAKERGEKNNAFRQIIFNRDFNSQQGQQIQQNNVQQEDLSDEDYIADMTQKDFGALIDKRIRSNQNTAHPQPDNGLMIQQENVMRSQHADYDEVISEIVTPMMVTDPTLSKQIYSQPDPARYAYNLGMGQPGYVEKIKKTAATQATKKTVQKIQENANRASSLSNVGGGGKTKSMTEEERIESLSDEDFEKELAKVKNSMA